MEVSLIKYRLWSFQVTFLYSDKNKFNHHTTTGILTLCEVEVFGGKFYVI